MNYNSERFTSPSLRPKPQPPPDEEASKEKLIVISASEGKQLQDILSTKYRIVHTAGAGYKALLVAQQKADLWVLSQDTTHFWDTCGPHSLLGAMGGGMLKFTDALLAEETDSGALWERQIVYSSPSGEDNCEFRNLGGVIAYTKPGDVVELLQLLRDNGYSSNKQN